jgi:hypothetical protein
MAERIFSLPTHTIDQAKNPTIAPKTIRTIVSPSYFLEMSSPRISSVIEVQPAPRSLCHILPTPFRLVVVDIFLCPEDLRVDNDYAAANSEKDTE